MANATAQTAVSAPAPAPAPVAPVALFLGLEAAALVLSAARVPFSASFMKPAEAAATQQLLVIQAAAISLLFPWLGRSLRTAAVAAISLFPMLIFSSLLAGRPAANIIAPAIFLSLWLCTLMILSYTLREDRTRLLALAVVAGWCAAGPLAWYLRMEFSDNPGPVPLWLAGPIRGPILLLDNPLDWAIWLPLLVALAISIGISMTCRKFAHFPRKAG